MYFRDYLGKQTESSAGSNTNMTNNTLGQRPVESRA
jgi:hypothetical protein